MKKKIVLRLLAAVMAATLVVTGVPSAALTGIETVYAGDFSIDEVKAVTYNSITVSASQGKYYIAVEVTGEEKTPDNSSGVTDWTQAAQVGSTETYTATLANLKPGTAYKIYECAGQSQTVSQVGTTTQSTYKASLATAQTDEKLTINLSGGTLTYDKTAQKKTVTSVTIAYGSAQTLELTRDKDYTVSYENYNSTNAGTYNITITATSNSKYLVAGTEATTTYEIGKKTVTPTITVADKVYDGTTAVTVNATIKSGLETGDSITITGLTGALESAGAAEEIQLSSIDKTGESITGEAKDNYTIEAYSTSGIKGKVTKAEKADLQGIVDTITTPTLTSDNTKITVTAATKEGFTYQYALSEDSADTGENLYWQDTAAMTNYDAENALVAGKAYYGYVRLKADETNNDASASVRTAGTIMLAAATPAQISTDNATPTDTTIVISNASADNQYAYRLGTDNESALVWVDPVTVDNSNYTVTFTGLDPNTAYNVYQRVAATDTAEASAASTAQSVTTKKRSIADAEITLEYSSYEYTGAAIEPKVTSVTLDNGATILTENDYDVTYGSSYNTDVPAAGETKNLPTVTVTAKGDKYDTSTSKTVNFDITKKLSGSFAELAAPTLSVDNSKIKVTAAADAPEHFDYEYAISKSDDGTGLTAWQTSAEFETDLGTDAWYGYVRIKATANNEASNYAVSATSIKASAQDISKLTNAKVVLSETSAVYTGTDLADTIKSYVSVTYGSSSENKVDSDKYTVSFTTYDAATAGDTTNVGKLTVTVTGNGPDYYGSLSYTDSNAYFEITKKPINATITVTGSRTYVAENTSIALTAIAGTTEGVASGDTVIITGLTGTLASAGTNSATPEQIAVSTVVSDAVNVIGEGHENYEITYKLPEGGLKATIIQDVPINVSAGSSTVTVHYGETVSLTASNPQNAAMTYTLGGTGDMGDTLFDVNDDGTITCKNYSAELATKSSNTDGYYTVTVKFANPGATENYELKAATTATVKITLAKATPKITLGDNVATGESNTITVAKDITEAQLKKAIGATLTYDKDSTEGTTYDISDQLVYSYDASSSSGLYEGSFATASANNTFYVKLSYAGKDGIDAVASGNEKKITVTVAENGLSDVPTITAENEKTSFTDSTKITLAAAEGAVIYYTTDGTTPVADESKCNRYYGEFTISETTTIKAIAVEVSDDKAASEVVSETFTKLAANAKTISISVADATITVGDTYKPSITVSDSTVDVDADITYTITNKETEKEVTLAEAIATAGEYIVKATVKDLTKYDVTGTTDGALTVNSVKDALEAAEQKGKDSLQQTINDLTEKNDSLQTSAEKYDALAASGKTDAQLSEIVANYDKVSDKADAYDTLKGTLTDDALKNIVTSYDTVSSKADTYDSLKGTLTDDALKNIVTSYNTVSDKATTYDTLKGTLTDEALKNIVATYDTVSAAAAQVDTLTKEKEAAQKAAEEAATKQKEAEAKLEAAATTAAATKVGDTVKIDGNTYKVTSVDKKTVSFSAVKKNATSAYIVSTVTINGVDYKVTAIAKNAFKGDTKLTSVTIPTTVKTIGESAFSGCTKLASIVIPKNVTSIGKQAFYKCSKLKTVTIKSSKITKIGSKAFTSIAKKATIKVPSKKLSAYKKLLKTAKFTGTTKKA